MSLFYGLNIAASGLFASQKALDVTSHNVANANTSGYTREEVVFKANAPSMGLTTSSAYGNGQVGAGVSIEDIERVRDIFLDSQYRNENSISGEWGSKNQILTAVQQIFNEPSDSGITTVISNFFDSLQELSKNPESNNDRSLVRQNAISLTDTVNHLYNQLSAQKDQAVFNLKTDITQINTLADQISSLDDQIYKFETTGNKANDLRDQRDELVDKLSGLVDIKAYETSNGQYRIDIGGRTLVDGNTSYHLVYADNGQTVQNPSDVIKWQGEENGSGVDIQSGEVKGLFDMIYGDSSGLKGIPYYMDQLDDFAYYFAKAFNDVHTQGYALDSTTGNNFFDTKSMTDSGHKGYAKIFSISSTINDPVSGLNMIAASGTGEPGNNENALKLAALSTDTNVIPGKSATFGDFVNSIISGLGVDGQQAGRMSTNQDNLVKQVDNLRAQTSGVSLDEEMTNLIKFQHSYQAAAKVISTIDSMLGTLLNIS